MLDRDEVTTQMYHLLHGVSLPGICQVDRQVCRYVLEEEHNMGQV
jgi:hypothetical protein